MKEKQTIIPLRIVTAQELDPLTASCINMRFSAFFSRFCEEAGLHVERAALMAKGVLHDAEIPQDVL